MARSAALRSSQVKVLDVLVVLVAAGAVAVTVSDVARVGGAGREVRLPATCSAVAYVLLCERNARVRVSHTQQAFGKVANGQRGSKKKEKTTIARKP